MKEESAENCNEGILYILACLDIKEVIEYTMQQNSTKSIGINTETLS